MGTFLRIGLVVVLDMELAEYDDENNDERDPLGSYSGDWLRVLWFLEKP